MAIVRLKHADGREELVDVADYDPTTGTIVRDGVLYLETEEEDDEGHDVYIAEPTAP
jgi:hypothetical protein